MNAEKPYLCSKCGEEIKSSEKFCHSCGTKVDIGARNHKQFCSECGKQIYNKGNFCPECGSKNNTMVADKEQKGKIISNIAVTFAILCPFFSSLTIIPLIAFITGITTLARGGKRWKGIVAIIVGLIYFFVGAYINSQSFN